MYNINFCKHWHDCRKHELKEIRKLVIAEANKKQEDEHVRAMARLELVKEALKHANEQSKL